MYSTVDNVKKSLKLAWKFKMLWIFALVLAGLSGSFNSNNFDFDNFNKSKESSLNSSFIYSEEFQSSLLAEFPELNIRNYYVDVFGLVAVFILASLVSFVFIGFERGWAVGSTLQSTKDVIENSEINLRKSSETGMATAWELFKLNLLTIGLFLGAVIVLALIFMMVIATKIIPLAILFGIVFGVAFVIILIFFALSLSFTYRFIVFDKMKAWNAFVLGLSTTKSNLGRAIELILLNFAIGVGLIIGLSILGLIVIAILGLIVLAASLPFKDNTAGMVVIGLTLPFFIVGGLFVISVFTGYTTSYSELTWTNLYNYIKGRSTNAN
ncbi:MAG: hypothetical protein ACD_22C00133G0002 [uncultured bacterium]|nr:MAG: hypothetical protein ACD_22C00133G0002 [uncultured bacterium]